MKIIFGLGLLLILVLASSCNEFLDYLSPTTSSTSSSTTAASKPVTSPKPTTSITISSSTPTTTSTTPPSSTIASGTVALTRNYSANKISFDYPSTWQNKDVREFKDPSLLASFSDPATGAMIQIAGTNMPFVPSQQELKSYHDSWVNAVIVGQPISSGRPTVAGAPAYETTFNDKTARWRVVCLSKGSMIYDISLSSAPASFDKVNKDFNILLNSFRVQ
jgi:hypothetical protein